jgi:hypothetical protein
MLLATFGVFFWEGLGVRFASGFFARLLAVADFVADLDVAGLATLRLAGLDAAARFAFGRVDLA